MWEQGDVAIGAPPSCLPTLWQGARGGRVVGWRVSLLLKLGGDTQREYGGCRKNRGDAAFCER